MDEWRTNASCRGANPDLWFPDLDADDETTGSAAKAICGYCPSLRPCAIYAITSGIRHGIWGGMGRDRRLRLRGILNRGDPQAFEAAFGAELDDLARTVADLPDDRPHHPASECPRCQAMVPAGRLPVDRNGPNATCGIAATYNKGCRCLACVEAKADYDQVQKARRRQRDRDVADGYNGAAGAAEDPGSVATDPTPGANQ